MLAFIVPVKSKTVTSDWRHFSSLVNRTINSICNQKESNFKVLVSCHEKPITDFDKHPNVEFLQMDFAPPILENTPDDRWLKETDKGKKIKHAAKYAKELGYSYVMTVDSDDCISNKIHGFVTKNADDSILGWYVNKGYLYHEGKKYAYLNYKNFHTLCGSCVIIKPDYIDLMFGKNSWFDHERTVFKNDLSLLPLPFPGSLYSMLNGTNILIDRQEMNKRTQFSLFSRKSFQTLFRRLRKYVIVPLILIKDEFSIHPV